MNKEDTADYARGYAAGRKRLDRDLAHEDLTKREAEVWQKYMAASLEFALTQSTCTQRGNKISTLDDRIELAGRIANMALLETKINCKL